MKTTKKKQAPKEIEPAAPEPVAPPKIEVASGEDLNKKLLEALEKAAIDGANEIINMITSKTASDASRLAAAKWAVERAVKDKGPDTPDAKLNTVLELVRELRAVAQPGQKVQPATLPGQPAQDQPDSPAHWDKWIASNLKH